MTLADFWAAYGTLLSFLGINAILALSIYLTLAAGLLYPFFGILLSPMVAGAAMALSSVSVIANALRLRRA